MPQQRPGEPADEGRHTDGRWTLGVTAPGWFRRIWGERSRDIPRAGDPGGVGRRVSEADLVRLRRIAYL